MKIVNTHKTNKKSKTLFRLIRYYIVVNALGKKTDSNIMAKEHVGHCIVFFEIAKVT